MTTSTLKGKPMPEVWALKQVTTCVVGEEIIKDEDELMRGGWSVVKNTLDTTKVSAGTDRTVTVFMKEA